MRRRSRRRGRRRPYLASALAFWLAGASAAPAAAAAAPTAPAVPYGEGLRITLITGDVVDLHDWGGTLSIGRIERAPGRGRIHFLTMRLDGHLYAIPSDAQRLVGTGRLDERMFDLTRQAHWNYDDAHRPAIPLLAMRAPGKVRTTLRHVSVTRSYRRSNLDVMHLTKTDAGRFWRSLTAARRHAGHAELGGGVARLWLDGKRRVLRDRVDRTAPWSGAPAARRPRARARAGAGGGRPVTAGAGGAATWRKAGTAPRKAGRARRKAAAGLGVTVAVLDTGYDVAHPDLRGAVTEAKGFTDAGDRDVQDRFGHGTHVAWTVAGSGAASHGRHTGVAPGARLVVGKVLDDRGMGQESWIIAGMEWASTRARVVTMSLGTADTRGVDPLEQEVGDLTARTGTLFVLAAGNGGPGPGSVASPASADAALAVGAADDHDGVAGFSAGGPRPGDFAVKPDITAPGVGVTAAVPVDHRHGRTPYATMSGTSAAAPHVAAAAAIVAARHPGWSARRLKEALMGAARPAAGVGVYRQGAGRVDVARAAAQQVTASPGSMSLFLSAASRTPATRTVTYTNDSGRPVTLRLATTARRHGGGAAPPALFRPSAGSVTVPPRSRVPVRVTVDPHGVRPGLYGGALTASGGHVRLRTVLAAYAEPPAARLTVRVIDRRGRPADALLAVHDQRTSYHELLWTGGGSATAHFPAGDYNLTGVVETPRPHRPALLAVVNVPVSLTGANRDVVIDTRRAVRPDLGVDEPRAQNPGSGDVAILYRREKAGYALVVRRSPKETYVLPVRQRGLDYYARRTFYPEGYSPQHPGRFRYEVVDHRTGEVPKDPRYTAVTTTMARVATVFRAPHGRISARDDVALLLPDGSRMSDAVQRVSLPYRATEYFTAGAGLRWWHELDYGRGAAGAAGAAAYLRDDTPEAMRAGAAASTWDAAVLGPGLPAECVDTDDPLFTGACAVRTGDTIAYGGDFNLFCGGGAHDHCGDDPAATGTVTLSRDGKVVKKAELQRYFAAGVPHRAGRYHLKVSARRGGTYTDLSTRIEARYAFSSSATSARRPLPLMAVRFTPRGLDDRNQARPGSTIEIPLWVQHARAGGRVEALTVSASYDDGRTWHRVTLDRTADGWTARVHNPARGFVSLRAEVTDAGGASVRQTIVHAYAIGL